MTQQQSTPNAAAHSEHERIRQARRKKREEDPIAAGTCSDGAIHVVDNEYMTVNWNPGEPWMSLDGVFALHELRQLVAHLEKYPLKLDLDEHDEGVREVIRKNALSAPRK